MSFEARKPDWNLKARIGEREARIGVGWNNAKGYINIQIDPFIVIKSKKGLVVTLFPADKDKDQ